MLMGVVRVVMHHILSENLIFWRIPGNWRQGHGRGHIPSLALSKVTGHGDLGSAKGGGLGLALHRRQRLLLLLLWLLEGGQHGLLKLLSESLLLGRSRSGHVGQGLGWGYASHRGLFSESLIASLVSRLLLLAEGGDLSRHVGR